MKTIRFSIMMVLAAMMMTGCVSKKRLTECEGNNEKLLNELSTLQKRIEQLQSEKQDQLMQLTESKTNGKSLEQRLKEAQAQLAEKQATLKEMQKTLDQSIMQGGKNISKLVDEINASNKYIKQLVEAKSKSDSLNVALTNKLTRSLSREELKDVDVKVLKGVVYISLNDNMLYKSGSYEISPAAAATLSKIAKIITDYKDYEVLVEGNTDNVPIRQTNISNNWDLSALRASSVVQELQNKYGVNPSRLTAGGRGEYNPVADNETPEGRSQNRRTQIIITPQLDQFLDLIDAAPEAEEETVAEE